MPSAPKSGGITRVLECSRLRGVRFAAGVSATAQDVGGLTLSFAIGAAVVAVLLCTAFATRMRTFFGIHIHGKALQQGDSGRDENVSRSGGGRRYRALRADGMVKENRDPTPGTESAHMAPS